MAPFLSTLGSNFTAYQIAAAGGAVSPFPPAYQVLINNAESNATAYYVDPAGNNNNNGRTLATAWATINYATATAPAGSTIIIYPGTYRMPVAYNAGSFGAKVFYDENKQLNVVCAPGGAKILSPVTDPGTRDFNMILLGSNSTKVYGMTIYRDNNGRGTNYNNAVFGYPDPAANRGDVWNSFFRETGPNSNGNWSMHYDNPNNHNWSATNCSFMGGTFQSNYTGGTSSVMTDCAGTQTWATAGTNTRPLYNASFNADFTCQSTTQGVYGGTYAWDTNLITQTL